MAIVEREIEEENQKEKEAELQRVSLLEQVKGNVAQVEPSSGDYHDNISLIKQKVR